MKRAVKGNDEHAFGKTWLLDCWHKIEPHNLISVGDEIECQQCISLAFPEGLNPYKRTPVFNQETIPKGFRRAHATKQGVWARINVLNGRVRYVIDDLNNQSFDLDPGTLGTISPQMEHHLEVIGDVELYVEFYTGQRAQ